MAGGTFQLFEEYLGGAWYYALDFGFLLVFGAGGSHGEGFAGAGLAVGEDGDIVALDERGHAFLHVLKDAFLVDVFAENAVEDEELAAVGGIHGDLLARGDLDARGLEALRDELVARVAILQWWTHANSCIRLVLERRFCREKTQCRVIHSPTLTAVRESSSEAREPPCLLLMLILLLERTGRIMALKGRWRAAGGEPGGVAIVCRGAAVPLVIYAGVRSVGRSCAGWAVADEVNIVDADVGVGELFRAALIGWVRSGTRRCWFRLCAPSTVVHCSSAPVAVVPTAARGGWAGRQTGSTAGEAGLNSAAAE